MNKNQTANCLLCGSATTLLEEKYPGYQEPDTFEIHYCPCCNTSFSLPRVETSHIYEQIYQKGDKVSGYDRYWRYLRAIKNKKHPFLYLSESEEAYWAIRKALSNIARPKENLKIMEVGCGLGYLTYALRKDGYHATGLDISQKAVDDAVKNFGNHYICANVIEYAAQHKASLDVIVLTEVIEHVEEPIVFLESLTRLLADGGQIILTTPNKTIYPANIVWKSDLPPVHLWWFSEDSMRYIAGKLNTDVQFVDFSDYYKKRRMSGNVTSQQNIREISHRFTSDGKIIEPSKSPFQILRSMIAKVPCAQYFYDKISPNRYKYGKNGLVLGVILQK
jgi:SAM-dependent methyltransferase